MNVDKPGLCENKDIGDFNWNNLPNDRSLIMIYTIGKDDGRKIIYCYTWNDLLESTFKSKVETMVKAPESEQKNPNPDVLLHDEDILYARENEPFVYKLPYTNIYVDVSLRNYLLNFACNTIKILPFPEKVVILERFNLENWKFHIRTTLYTAIPVKRCDLLRTQYEELKIPCLEENSVEPVNISEQEDDYMPVQFGSADSTILPKNNIRLSSLLIDQRLDSEDGNESDSEDENESIDEDENESVDEDENESDSEDENESDSEDENESVDKDENESSYQRRLYSLENRSSLNDLINRNPLENFESEWRPFTAGNQSPLHFEREWNFLDKDDFSEENLLSVNDRDLSPSNKRTQSPNNDEPILRKQSRQE